MLVHLRESLSVVLCLRLGFVKRVAGECFEVVWLDLFHDEVK